MFLVAKLITRLNLRILLIINGFHDDQTIPNS